MRIRHVVAVAAAVFTAAFFPIVLGGCNLCVPGEPSILCPNPPAGPGAGGPVNGAGGTSAGTGGAANGEAPGEFTSCNPCSDGQGGTLQNVGEYCNGDSTNPIGAQCCAGLKCTSTSTESGICQGTLKTCPPPTGSAGFLCDLPGEQEFACNISFSVAPPQTLPSPDPEPCGLWFCASSAANARWLVFFVDEAALGLTKSKA